jgi:hypothetical protein
MTEGDTSFPITFDAVFDRTSAAVSWLIDGEPVPAQQSEVARYNSLTLTWRATTDVLTDHLRQLKPDQGQVATLGTDDGGYVAVDRADGGNTFTLTPPDRRRPLRFERDYHVRDYEEDLVSQTADEWNVEVEFVPAANRTDSPSITDALSGQAFDAAFDWTFGDRDAEWKFRTRYGNLVSNRVDAELIGTGRGGVTRFSLTARFTKAQAEVFEAAFNRLGGVRVREIPDAANEAVDDTGDMTTTVNSPDTAVVSDGDYVVLDWESTRLTDAYQSITFTVAAT